ncbi:MAG TPA: DUF4135 domain-containing protein [Chlamydiales bacterium]|nr:DUF4135 domain-containing protein [Chlamydiales bacterium]
MTLISEKIPSHSFIAFDIDYSFFEAAPISDASSLQWKTLSAADSAFSPKEHSKVASTIPLIAMQSIHDLVRDSSTQKRGERLSTAMSYVGRIWVELQLPRCSGSATGKNAEFLANKLHHVIGSNIDETLKEKICLNIVRNFVYNLNEAKGRIDADLTDQKFRDTFNIRNGIFTRCSVTSITPLGEETHKRGKIPFLVTFSNGRKVVYKPRSMKVEQLICGNEGSVFSKFRKEGLNTYAVYNKKTQDYGYAEFIESNGTELTTEESKGRPSSLELYADRFILVDQISRQLGLSDLHMENIITRRSAPLLIDAEVAMAPTDTDAYREVGTCLLDGGTAGYRFYGISDNHAGTAIVLREKQGAIPFEDAEASQQLRLAIETSKKTSGPLDPNWTQHQAIESVKHTLEYEKHRIVLIKTSQLVSMIEMSPTDAMAIFHQNLLEGASWWGFEITADPRDLERLFVGDVENNDVPVFYQNPSTGNLYYNGEVIGRRLGGSVEETPPLPALLENDELQAEH